MPKIPTYSPQRRTGGNTLPVEPTSPQRGEGLTQFGKSAENAAAILQRAQEQREISKLEASLSERQVQFSESLNQRLQSAQRGEDLVEPVAQEVDESVASLEQEIETAAGQQYLQKAGSRMRAHFARKAAEGQAELAGIWAVEDHQRALNNWTSALVGDPSQFEQALQNHDDALEARVETQGMKASAAARLKTSGHAALAKSTVRGQIRIDPLQAKAGLEAGAWDEYIDGDTKVQLLREAERNITQADANAKANVSLYLEDTLATIEETGEDPGLLSEEDIRAAYPDHPERANKILDKIHNAKEYYGIRQDVGLTTPEQDAAKVAQMTERAGGVNAVQERRQRDDYVRAIENKREALAEDPLGYVFSVSPELRERFRNSADNPEQFREVLYEANELQADLGVPEHARSFMGKSTAEATTEQINSIDPESAADTLEGMARQYGPLWPQAMRELRSAGMNASYMTLSRLDEPTDAVTRKKLASALQTGKKTLRQNVGETGANDIDRAVEEHLTEFEDTLAYDGRAGQEILHAETASAQMLAYMYHQQGMTVEAAAQRATSDLINDRYEFYDTYRTPAGIGGKVQSAVDRVERTLSPEMFPPAPGGPASLTEEYRRRANMNTAMRGAWANTPMGDGIELLYPDGSPVILDNGEPVQIMFNDLEGFESTDSGLGFGSARDLGVAQ